jgi:hypothetical protein
MGLSKTATASHQACFKTDGLSRPPRPIGSESAAANTSDKLGDGDIGHWYNRLVAASLIEQ